MTTKAITLPIKFSPLEMTDEIAENIPFGKSPTMQLHTWSLHTRERFLFLGCFSSSSPVLWFMADGETGVMPLTTSSASFNLGSSFLSRDSNWPINYRTRSHMTSAWWVITQSHDKHMNVIAWQSIDVHTTVHDSNIKSHDSHMTVTWQSRCGWLTCLICTILPMTGWLCTGVLQDFRRR